MFYFLFSLLQKMKHNNTVIINKKSKIMTIVKNFREEIALYGFKDKEKLIECLEKSIKFHKEIANDKNENNIKYLDECINYFGNLFKNYSEKNNYLKKNINPVSEEIEPITHNSTFVKTPTWLGPKKCTINPQNDDNKCFQYSVTLSLYHEQIGRNPFSVSKIKPFANNLNWNNINFSPKEQDYKTLKMNNKSIGLNILQHSDEKISHVSKSEFSKTREKQVILLIITDGQKQYHIFVKKINSLLKKKYACSENYCLNYLKPFISIKLRGNAFLLS